MGSPGQRPLFASRGSVVPGYGRQTIRPSGQVELVATSPGAESFATSSGVPTGYGRSSRHVTSNPPVNSAVVRNTGKAVPARTVDSDQLATMHEYGFLVSVFDADTSRPLRQVCFADGIRFLRARVGAEVYIVAEWYKPPALTCPEEEFPNVAELFVEGVSVSKKYMYRQPHSQREVRRCTFDRYKASDGIYRKFAFTSRQQMPASHDKSITLGSLFVTNMGSAWDGAVRCGSIAVRFRTCTFLDLCRASDMPILAPGIIQNPDPKRPIIFEMLIALEPSSPAESLTVLHKRAKRAVSRVQTEICIRYLSEQHFDLLVPEHAFQANPVVAASDMTLVDWISANVSYNRGYDTKETGDTNVNIGSAKGGGFHDHVAKQEKAQAGVQSGVRLDNFEDVKMKRAHDVTTSVPRSEITRTPSKEAVASSSTPRTLIQFAGSLPPAVAARLEATASGPVDALYGDLETEEVNDRSKIRKPAPRAQLIIDKYDEELLLELGLPLPEGRGIRLSELFSDRGKGPLSLARSAGPRNETQSPPQRRVGLDENDMNLLRKVGQGIPTVQGRRSIEHLTADTKFHSSSAQAALAKPVSFKDPQPDASAPLPRIGSSRHDIDMNLCLARLDDKFLEGSQAQPPPRGLVEPSIRKKEDWPLQDVKDFVQGGPSGVLVQPQEVINDPVASSEDKHASNSVSQVPVTVPAQSNSSSSSELPAFEDIDESGRVRNNAEGEIAEEAEISRNVSAIKVFARQEATNSKTGGKAALGVPSTTDDCAPAEAMDVDDGRGRFQYGECKQQ